MLPLIVLGGIAAAALLSGCSPHKPATKTPTRPRREPDPKYETDFGEDPKAKWVHLQLKSKGIPDANLDQGCSVIHWDEKDNLTNPGGLGKGDHKIESCEVYGFALDRYQDAGFRPIVETISGKPIPWVLDDFNIHTTFDNELRKSIHKQIKKFDQMIRKMGFKPDSPEYQERMAMGLFTMMAIPSWGLRLPKQEVNPGLFDDVEILRRSFENLKGELKKLGMESVWDHFSTHGGLRINALNTEEYTALEALDQRMGNCTEHSKILYAAYKMAGLKPEFVISDPLKSGYEWIKKWAENNPGYSHQSVGLEINGKFRHFDTAITEPRAKHNSYVRLNLLQALSAHFTSRGVAFWEQGKIPEAIKESHRATSLDPYNGVAFSNGSNYYREAGQKAQALEYANRAIQIQPRNEGAYLNRAKILVSMGERKAALKDYDHLVELNPENPMVYYNRGLLLMGRRRDMEAREDFIKFFQIRPHLAKKLMLPILEHDFRNMVDYSFPTKEKETFESESGLDLLKTMVQIELVAFIWAGGHPKMAKEPINVILNIIEEQQQALSAKRKSFSPVTLKILYGFYSNLPPELKTDPEIESKWNRLALPLPPH